jgi:hypothetical protein
MQLLVGRMYPVFMKKLCFSLGNEDDRMSPGKKMEGFSLTVVEW